MLWFFIQRIISNIWPLICKFIKQSFTILSKEFISTKKVNLIFCHIIQYIISWISSPMVSYNSGQSQWLTVRVLIEQVKSAVFRLCLPLSRKHIPLLRGIIIVSLPFLVRSGIFLPWFNNITFTLNLPTLVNKLLRKILLAQ